MIRFELDTWDSGQLTVNRAFAPLLQQHGWATFHSIWSRTADAAVAKNLRTDRITLRFTLHDQGHDRTFYIKRHVRSSWKEYVKPLFRLTWPILGARNEWNAILKFHEVGLPTMTPVAIGESGSDSFLITESLEPCRKLSELVDVGDDGTAVNHEFRSKLIREIAQIAQTMHRAGLHHQDFYLGHLMKSQFDQDPIYVIDLGRVQQHATLSRRWIVKDLAQLNFSVTATPREKVRFLRLYLGRRLTKHDRSLIASIQAKTASIARHSHKNRL